MWKFIGKMLLLGAARRWAKRPTAAVETAALVLVLNERRLGRGPKRDVLLRGAHLIFLPAAVIKTVHLIKYLAAGGRRGSGGIGAATQLPLPDPGLGGAAAVPSMGADDGDAAGAVVDPLGAEAAETATGPVLSFRHQPPPLPRLLPRAEWGLLQIPEVAPDYAAWVRCLRNVLAQQGLRSLPAGVDPDGLELTRYLLYGGLLAAHKPADAARAVAATAARVTSSVGWRASYPFMTPRELQDWDEVTWWAGPDPDGTLWLHVHLARAVVRCNRGEGRKCVQAIISQLDYGTRVLMMQPVAAAEAAVRGSGLHSTSSGVSTPTAWVPQPSTIDKTTAGDVGESDEDEAGSGRVAVRDGRGTSTSAHGCAGCGWRRRSMEAATGSLGRAGSGGIAGRIDDRIRVVVVGSGSNVRQVVRMLPLLREFARLVQRHYPGRLRAMYLVDMLRGLRMSVGAVLNLLSAETRQKVKVCRVEDLPDCISGAIAFREVAQQQNLAERGLRASVVVTQPQREDDGDGGGSAAGASGHGARGVNGGDSSSVTVGRALVAGLVLVVAAGLQPLRLRTAAAQLQQLHELRLWLVRVVPALVMAAMACLTYKSLLARP
ncbi:hypothetical protein Vretimale_2461 [Volvox reticuliferus]|uniref:CRAL-TRIO domain-containing protein n=1 Tax=Volvox reticuliferus TaxID=1737510 RepID=A0A8J4FKU2_9CHLO|nr:hypothetical protein Vretifemale_4760 [Volvox reticuliferus]GIL96699.1 hypothetical protein Vretimale_2461 [Volvox reticuliferus]